MTAERRPRHDRRWPPRRSRSVRAGAHGEEGQSTVELVALLPVLVAIAFAVAQLLMAGAAKEYAGHAAEAGAVALLEGGDPAAATRDAVAAARDAVPGWSRSRVDVRVRGHTIRVAVRPTGLVPPLADLLVARAEAKAG